MLAIANACPENDLFDARTVHLQGFFDRDERHEIAMAFKHISNPLANGQGVAVDRGVGDECCGHGAWTEVLYSQLAQIGCASWLVLALQLNLRELVPNAQHYPDYSSVARFDHVVRYRLF